QNGFSVHGKCSLWTVAVDIVAQFGNPNFHAAEFIFCHVYKTLSQLWGFRKLRCFAPYSRRRPIALLIIRIMMIVDDIKAKIYRSITFVSPVFFAPCNHLSYKIRVWISKPPHNYTHTWVRILDTHTRTQGPFMAIIERRKIRCILFGALLGFGSFPPSVGFIVALNVLYKSQSYFLLVRAPRWFRNYRDQLRTYIFIVSISSRELKPHFSKLDIRSRIAPIRV